MGLFNLFKGHAKDKKNDSMPVHNGPTYLEGFASPIQNFKDKTGQWRANLVSPDGNTQFKIKYYGQRHEKSENLIVGTEIAPPLVLAVHITTEDTILLFDGCKHGYNALFCDTYSTKQLEARSATNFYTTSIGTDVFEITITTYNSIDYEDEFPDQIDDNGSMELVNGEKMELDKVRRDGYGAIRITIMDSNDKEVEILSEELA